MSNTTKPITLEVTTKTALPTEEPTKLRIALPVSMEVTRKVNLQDEALRDTIDVNRETPDLVPALLLDTEERADEWPEPSLNPPTELPTPPLLPSSEPDSLTTTEVLPMVVLGHEPRQEGIPTSVIAARAPREQIPTSVIATRTPRDRTPTKLIDNRPRKASALSWVALASIVGLLWWALAGGHPAPKPSVAPLAMSPAANIQAPTLQAPPPTPRESKPVSLEVSSSPKGALVSLDGEPLGVTPLKLKREATDKALQLVVSRDGFLSQERQIYLVEDVRESFVLEKRPLLSIKAQPTKTETTPKKIEPKKPPGKNDVPNPFK